MGNTLGRWRDEKLDKFFILLYVIGRRLLFCFINRGYGHIKPLKIFRLLYMKKFIFLFVAFFCVILDVCAANDEDLNVIPLGNGLELINEDTGYGLRKLRVLRYHIGWSAVSPYEVLEAPFAPKVWIPRQLPILVFVYRNGVNIYCSHNGAKVGEFFISSEVYGEMGEPYVSIAVHEACGRLYYTVYFTNYTQNWGCILMSVATYSYENNILYRVGRGLFDTMLPYY